MVTRNLYEFCFLIVIYTSSVSGELFSSIVHLHSAVHAEKEVADILSTYVQLEEIRLTKLKRITEEMRRHSQVALDDPDRYLTNPVDAFLFVKRHTMSWEREGEALLYDDPQVQDLKKKLYERRQHLPSNEDLHGVTAALLRLQDTYTLDTHSVALGDLGGHNVSTLSINDCYDIGRLSFIGQDYYHAADWMSYTLDWLNRDAHDDLTFHRSHLLDSLSFSKFMNGDVKEALNHTKDLLSMSPQDQRAVTNKIYYERILRDLDKSQAGCEDHKNHTSGVNITEELPKHYEGYQEYEALCRGDNTKAPVNKRPLKCRYRTRAPYFLLPVKEEEIHLDPWIVVYYDVISDSEIQILKDLSTPLLQRAVVYSSTDSYGVPANYRISKSSWLREEDDPLISALDARVDRFTGLNMDTAEALQVGNYGIGGHYEPHYDFAHTEESNFDAEIGNRQATFMFYLSDVTAGGATVFPHIGVRVLPIKGAGVFWYNLRRSGVGLFDTWHAGCPVLVGTKWVANKWIHERGQEYRKPCGLTVDE